MYSEIESDDNSSIVFMLFFFKRADDDDHNNNNRVRDFFFDKRPRVTKSMIQKCHYGNLAGVFF